MKYTLIFGVIILLTLLAIAFLPQAECAIIDVDKIIQIESSGNAKAISRDGFDSIGLMQISKCVRVEYNQYNKTSYTRSDLFNPDVNIAIGKWYLNKRIPQMLRYYKKPVTVTNIIWAYNAGIGNVVKGRLPEITKRYIKKYN